MKTTNIQLFHSNSPINSGGINDLQLFGSSLTDKKGKKGIIKIKKAQLKSMSKSNTQGFALSNQ